MSAPPRAGKARAARWAPEDLTLGSSVEEVRAWIDFACDHEDERRTSVTHEELVVLVRHLQECRLASPLLQTSEDPKAVAKSLLLAADVDGSKSLRDSEFAMLWELCAPPSLSRAPARRGAP
jgi:hypothetical protein